MDGKKEGPRVSRGEEALYGEHAYGVRQVGLAYVAVTDARDEIVDWLKRRFEEHHEPEGETWETWIHTAPEGSVARDWNQAFGIVAAAEQALEKAFFELAAFALECRKSQREGVDSLPSYNGSSSAPHGGTIFNVTVGSPTGK